jgi:hypothetical protein
MTLFTTISFEKMRLRRALSQLQVELAVMVQQMNDPKGDGSGDDARPPTGDDFNRLAEHVEVALKALK